MKIWRAALTRFMERHVQVGDPDMVQVKRIAASVRRVSAYIPAASCLTQALATQLLLARRGIMSTLRIGVCKDEDGEFKAHAWLECAGKIIIGANKEYRSYTVLHALKEAK